MSEIATKFLKDGVTDSVVSVTYEQSSIHDGIHYYMSGIVDLALSATADFLIVTGESQPHFKFKIDSTDKVRLYIYEDAVITTTGTSHDIFNNDRDSLNVAHTKIFDSPVLSTLGSLILQSSSGDKGSTGFNENNEGIMFAKNTNYFARIISDVNNITASVLASFHEDK